MVLRFQKAGTDKGIVVINEQNCCISLNEPEVVLLRLNLLLLCMSSLFAACSLGENCNIPQGQVAPEYIELSKGQSSYGGYIDFLSVNDMTKNLDDPASLKVNRCTAAFDLSDFESRFEVGIATAAHCLNMSEHLRNIVVVGAKAWFSFPDGYVEVPLQIAQLENAKKAMAEARSLRVDLMKIYTVHRDPGFLAIQSTNELLVDSKRMYEADGCGGQTAEGTTVGQSVCGRIEDVLHLSARADLSQVDKNNSELLVQLARKYKAERAPVDAGMSPGFATRQRDFKATLAELKKLYDQSGLVELGQRLKQCPSSQSTDPFCQERQSLESLVVRYPPGDVDARVALNKSFDVLHKEMAVQREKLQLLWLDLSDASHYNDSGDDYSIHFQANVAPLQAADTHVRFYDLVYSSIFGKSNFSTMHIRQYGFAFKTMKNEFSAKFFYGDSGATLSMGKFWPAAVVSKANGSNKTDGAAVKALATRSSSTAKAPEVRSPGPQPSGSPAPVDALAEKGKRGVSLNKADSCR